MSATRERTAPKAIVLGVFAAGLLAATATGPSALAAPPAGGERIQLAQLFGESDEEKAQREQREQAQDAAIAELRQRVSDLEETLRRQTGANEELSHHVQELSQRIDRMQKDFDYKLCTMAGQQLGASTQPGDPSALPCNAPSQPSSVQGPPPSLAGGATELAPPSGVLGTLAPATPLPQSQPAAATAAPTATAPGNRPQFDAAMNLLAKTQYDEARAAFRGFADQYPKDDLAPQAVYWVGDIAYVQKDYPGAARAFAEEIKKYPSSPRAPESMLKLGQSLVAMGQNKEGCTTLGALTGKYPTASKAIAAQAAAARKAAACK
jgi:tol-pal system protein YbgF